jgi:PKD repeat protein
MMKRLKRITLLLFLSGLSSFVQSQCMLYEVPLNERIQASNYIVEARVVSQTPFWDAEQQHIYTSNILEVYKIFKGQISQNEIEIVTQGGQIDDKMEIVSPSLQLKTGDVGIFFGNNSNERLNSNLISLEAYAGEQGFVKYSNVIGKAFDHFHQYEIEQIYNKVESTLNQRYTNRASFDAVDYVNPFVIKAFSLTSISPTTLSAGIDAELTITGTDFGTNTGSAAVMFRNANDGGSSLVVTSATDILFWSETEIVCKVPSGAGTGSIRVRNSAGTQSNDSPTPLTVPYNLTNLGAAGEPVAILIRGASGYTFNYSTSTANAGVSFDGHTDAKARFEDALEHLRCETGFNANASGNTGIGTTANDGTFVIMFDNNAAPLSAGVLGVAHSYYGNSGCGWVVNDIDIRFRRDGTGGTTWYFGENAGAQPGGQTDFESVALHELGHTHQFGHTINSSDVMNFSLTTGQNNRVLNSNNVAAGTYVIDNGVNHTGGCGQTAMVAFDCGLPPSANFTSNTSGGCGAPQTINFSDASTGAPTSWSWNFGDPASGGDNTSTAQNPSHEYTAAGSYTVTLTATNDNGSDEEIKTAFINIFDAPTAAFCSPQTEDLASEYGIGIFNVTLNTINNSTNSSVSDGGYQDFTCSQITNLVGGETESMSVTVGGANDEDLKVYIDINNDGVFDEGTELVLNLTDIRNLNVNNITVPSNVSASNQNKILRMRVISDWFANGVANSCDAPENGQAEDYGVVICNIPTISAGDNARCGSGSVTISATPTFGTIQWFTASSGGTAIVTNGDYTVSGNNLTINNLASTTTFYAEATNGNCVSVGRTAVVATVELTTQVQASQQGSTLPFLGSNSFTGTPIIADAVLGATRYRFEVTEGGNTVFLTRNGRWFYLSNLPSYDYGKTYSIRVCVELGGDFGCYGNSYDVSSPLLPPTSQVIAEQRGTTMASMYNWIKAEERAGATNYRFRVTFNSATEVIETTNRYFYLSQLNNATYDTEYEIEVAVEHPNIPGFGDYGTPYSVFSPAITQVQSSQCSITLDNNSTAIIADAVQGATGYRFEVTQNGSTEVLTRSSRWFYLANLTSYLPNRIMKVRVSVQKGGVWGPYWTSCYITTPASGMIKNPNEEQLDKFVTVELNAYPNPNNGEFTISSSHEGTFNIINELGQLVKSIEITKENNYQVHIGVNSGHALNQKLQPGIYFITGTINNEVITKKIIVQ